MLAFRLSSCTRGPLFVLMPIFGITRSIIKLEHTCFWSIVSVKVVLPVLFEEPAGGPQPNSGKCEAGTGDYWFF